MAKTEIFNIGLTKYANDATDAHISRSFKLQAQIDEGYPDKLKIHLNKPMICVTVKIDKDEKPMPLNDASNTTMAMASYGTFAISL